jgi:hypothetical protein
MSWHVRVAELSLRVVYMPKATTDIPCTLQILTTTLRFSFEFAQLLQLQNPVVPRSFGDLVVCFQHRNHVVAILHQYVNLYSTSLPAARHSNADMIVQIA